MPTSPASSPAPPDPTSPAPPDPEESKTPAHLAPRTDDDETPRTTAQHLTPRHLRRSPSPEDTSRTPLEGLKSLLTRRNALIFVPAVAVAVVGLVIVSWAVDNARHSDQVHRNVSLAGHSVGGATEEQLAEIVAAIDSDVGERPVAVVVGDTEIDDVSAADLGLTVDEAEVVDAAMDVGRNGSILGRPLEWLGSMLSDRTVDLEYTLSETQISGALQLVYDESIEASEESAQARNPAIQLVDGQFAVEPGQPGIGLDLDQAADDLLATANATEDHTDGLEISVTTTEIAPSIDEEDAQHLADDLNEMTASGLTLSADDVEQSLSAEQLRTWITPIVDPQDAVAVEHIADEELDSLSELDWRADLGATDAAVTELFSDLSAEPVDAELTMANGNVEISESENGVTCCGEDVGQQVWDALAEGETSVELEVEVVEPEHTTEEVESWGISEPIGGSRGWRSGQEVPGPRPGYTTWEVGSGGRAHNIGLMADQVNGSLIGPGETWSINGHIGARQCPPYQEAGAIVNNEHVDDECGGGTSQFATTTLNAAYFAGLTVTGRAHSEYFDRYPAGREATMGAPGSGLDVTITNNTDYGVYIQSARHGDEVTVTIWSTDSGTVVEDLGNSESAQGNCRVVTNTRQRTYADGSSETDTFTATYRPGDGEEC